MSDRRTLLLASGQSIDLSEYLLKSEAETLYAPLAAIVNKQDKLVSGTNIKTISGESILGSGDVTATLSTSDGQYAIAKGIWDNYDVVRIETNGITFIPEEITDYTPQWSIHNNGDGTKFLSDDGTYKEVSGGGGSSAYSEVSHGTSDTTFALTPNTFHIWDEVSSLTLTLGAETNGVANEYLFQFTSGSEPTTLSLPDDIKWTGGDAPTIEANKIYQVSILKGLGSVLEWENSNIGTFTINYGQSSTVDFNFDKGMTWQDFVDSEYNTNSAITIYNSRVVYLNSFLINDVSPTDAIINMNIYLATYLD